MELTDRGRPVFTTITDQGRIILGTFITDTGLLVKRQETTYPTAAYTFPWVAERNYVLFNDNGTLTAYTAPSGLLLYQNGLYIAGSNPTYYKWTFDGTSWSAYTTMTATLVGSYYDTTLLISDVLFCCPGVINGTNDGSFMPNNPFVLPWASSAYTFPWAEGRNYVITVEAGVLIGYTLSSGYFFEQYTRTQAQLGMYNIQTYFKWTFDGTNWGTYAPLSSIGGTTPHYVTAIPTKSIIANNIDILYGDDSSPIFVANPFEILASGIILSGSFSVDHIALTWT
jgi:hypothetical protein